MYSWNNCGNADYEGLILARQESDADEYSTCEFKGEACESQCMEIIECKPLFE